MGLDKEDMAGGCIMMLFTLICYAFFIGIDIAIIVFIISLIF